MPSAIKGKKSFFSGKLPSLRSFSSSSEKDSALSSQEWTPPSSQSAASKSSQNLGADGFEEKILCCPEHSAARQPSKFSPSSENVVSVFAGAEQSTSSLPVAASPTAKCNKCGHEATRQVARASERNGNEARAYYKCFPCKKFICWEDDRGIHKINPSCHCGVLSRLQLTNPDKGNRLFHSCAKGTCNFYQCVLNRDGSEAMVDDKMSDLMRYLKLA